MAKGNKKEANLLVTFDPSHLESAKKEISELLRGTKEKVDFLSLDNGFAEICVGNAKKAVSELEKLAKKSTQKFNYTMQWIPIEKWCENRIEDIKKNIKGFVKDIGQNEKWKMELKTRKLKQKPDEINLILKLTEVVDRKKVDLNKPEKIIKVEIIGNRAGLALLKKNELLNVAKLKQLKK